MNTEPLIIMLVVQLSVTIVMTYCFWKVLKKPKEKEKNNLEK